MAEVLSVSEKLKVSYVEDVRCAAPPDLVFEPALFAFLLTHQTVLLLVTR